MLCTQAKRVVHSLQIHSRVALQVHGNATSSKERAKLNIGNIKQYVVPNVGGDFKEYGYIIGVLLLLFAIFLLLSRISKRNSIKRFVSKYFAWSTVIGLIIYFFRYENVAYFDSNIWLLFLLCIYIVGVAWLIVKKVRIAPIISENNQKINEFHKYLPKSKKKQPVKENNG